jgi:hypothetical protein
MNLLSYDFKIANAHLEECYAEIKRSKLVKTTAVYMDCTGIIQNERNHTCFVTQFILSSRRDK